MLLLEVLLVIHSFAFLIEPIIAVESSPEKFELCSPENLNLRNASSGDFILMNDGSFRYQMHHCKLRRFRVNEAAKCLKGLHLLFMGDSLARYFYLNFAALFAQGRWSLHFIDHYPEGRSFLSEKEFSSWMWFYQETNRALNAGNHAIEVCDCHRNDSVGFFDFIQDMFETRHFRYLPNGNLDDAMNDVRLSYIQWWGLMPQRGHQYISLNLPRSKNILPFLRNLNNKLCPNGGESFWPLSRHCSDQRPDIHQIDFPDYSVREICENYPNLTIDEWTKEDKCQRFERKILKNLNITHLILNTGWHAGLEHVGPKFLDKLVDAADKYFYPAPYASIKLPKVTWRQSTNGAVFESHDDIAKKYHSKDNEKLGFFSVGEITGKLKIIHDLLVNNDTIGLKRIVKVNPFWPKDRQLNSSTIHLIWHDPAHFEPYVYTEVNNLFLNAVCPLSEEDHKTKPRHVKSLAAFKEN
jgi:hypothetical protein